MVKKSGIQQLEKNNQISLSASNQTSHRYLFDSFSNRNSNNGRVGIPSCIRIKGSFTVEAAVALPVFAAVILFLLLFFRSMEVEQQLEEALIQAARESASVHLDKEETDLAKVTALFYFYASQKEAVNQYLKTGVWSIQIKEIELEDHHLSMTVVYPFRFPLGLGRLRDLYMENHIKCRVWDGYSIAETTETEYVFITPKGIVYHLSELCQSIKVSSRRVSKDQVEQLRNLDGSIYYRCSCTAEVDSFVYITDYGERYHGNQRCKSIKREVQRVRKSEVLDRRACRICGG
ncbi:MAG: TadE/TadG family type IV pilus assembly protein [Lachnospiraceae bacterium]